MMSLSRDTCYSNTSRSCLSLVEISPAPSLLRVPINLYQPSVDPEPGRSDFSAARSLGLAAPLLNKMIDAAAESAFFYLFIYF